MVTTVSNAKPIGLLQEYPKITDAKTLRATIDLALSRVSPGWKENMCELRRQYEGHIMESVAATMSRRFPGTAHRMPLAPYNLAAPYADSAASVYDNGVRRSLLDDAGKEIEEGDDAKLFAEMHRRARTDLVLAEMDRIRKMVRTCFVHVRSDGIGALATGKLPKTVLELFYPNDVMVIPHPMAPTLLQAALALLVRVSGSSASGTETFVHWRHDCALTPQGDVLAFGVWRADIITLVRTETRNVFGRQDSEKVYTRPLWDPYPLRTLPWVAFHDRIPAGSPYVDVDRNFAAVLNNTNATKMATIHTGDMATAPVWVHKTNEPQPKSIIMAPGVKVNIRLGEELSSEGQNSGTEAMRTLVNDDLELLALTKRISTKTFVAEKTSAPASGTALALASIPQQKARREDIEKTMPVEEEELLPLMCEVEDHWRGTDLGLGGERQFRSHANAPPNYEEPKTRDERLASAVAAKWISDERAAADADYYDNEEDARAAIEKLKAESEARAASMLPLSQPGETPMPNPDGTSGTGTPDGGGKPLEVVTAPQPRAAKPGAPKPAPAKA